MTCGMIVSTTPSPPSNCPTTCGFIPLANFPSPFITILASEKRLILGTKPLLAVIERLLGLGFLLKRLLI